MGTLSHYTRNIFFALALLSLSFTPAYAVNNPPVLATIGNKAVSADYTLTILVTATDPDPLTRLTYYTSLLPTGASFDPAKRTFTWTPVYPAQLGNYTVTFYVSDGTLTDSETINIKVGKAAYHFLAEATAPNFKAGNTLLRLSQCGWPLQYKVQKELSERWDYLMDIAPGKTGEWLTNPSSKSYPLVQLHLSDPERYPVSVYTRRVLQIGPDASPLLPEETWCHDPLGNRIGWISWGVPNWRVKPYISNTVALAIGETEIPRLQTMKDIGIQVSMVLNAAEYDITVPGNSGGMWRQDPAVSAWIDGLTDPVASYSSNKAKEEQAVRDACLSVYPDIPFVYYGTGDTRAGILNEADRIAWGWPHRYMSNAGTMPSWQLYYGHDGGADGTWNDIPPIATNCAAQSIAAGTPLMYNWLCAGWYFDTPSDNSPDDRYTGFLKFLYTLGCEGNNAGYYVYPAPGFEGEPIDAAPDWLRQEMILSQVHAVFTHLEDYLRNGDLLPGNGNHVWSYDLYGKVSWMHPSYEFTTNERNRNAHVVARKHRSKDAWLICAWAAAGSDRNVTVNIPELGSLTLLARAAGTLYIAVPGSAPVMLDENNALQPSLGLHVITTTPGQNGTIVAVHSNSVPNGGSETFNFIPDPGYVVDAVIVDSLSAAAGTSYTFTNVTTDHSLAVNFRPSAENYALTVQTNPVGISVSENGETKATPYTTIQLPVNTKITVTALANAIIGTQKYLFQHWIVNGTAQAANQYTLKLILRENITIQALYVLAVTPPTATAQSITLNEDTPYDIILTGVDVYGAPLTYTITTNPVKGLLRKSMAETDYYTYKPSLNYNGPDSFRFKASNGVADSTIVIVSINVLPVNDAPKAYDKSASLMMNTPSNLPLLSNDVDQNTLTYEIVTQPIHGALSGTGATRIYTPATGYVGTDSFTFRTYDGAAYSNNATFSLRIKTSNTAPIANNIWLNTNINKPTYPDLSVTAYDADNDALTYIILTQPSHGSLGSRDLPGGPKITYSPATGYTGLDSFTFKVNDNITDSNIATATAAIHLSNSAPVASNQSVNVDVGNAKAITLGATDIDDDRLSYTITAKPSHGALTGTAPNLTYTPTSGYAGQDYFIFKAYDGQAYSNLATITLNIGQYNSAPVANNQSVEANSGVATGITLTATDVNNDPLTYAIVTQPAHGTISGTAPDIFYTSTVGYSGADSFTFRANDGLINSNNATVSVTVISTNHAPVANTQTISTNMNTPLAITLTATDVDGDTLTYAIVANPAHGALSGSAPNLTYTPAVNYSGADSFTFRANDGLINSNNATVSVTVISTNHAPVANTQTISTNMNTPLAITLTATDVDGDTLTYAIVANPAHGALSGSAPNLTYTPAAGYYGLDSFTFRANDGLINSNTATVSITITNINIAPVANAQSVSTNQNTPLAITLTATDADGDALTYALATSPAHGVITGSGANRTYTPNNNYYGSDSFTFKANDGTLDSNIATVSITVTNTNAAPVLAPIGNRSVNEGSLLSFTISATDADGDAINYSASGLPTGATFSGNTFSWTPGYAQAGSYNVTFTASDGALTDSETISITVNDGTNHAPVASTQSVSTNQNTPLSITLSATDADGDSLTYAIVASPAHGALSGTAPNLTYTPTAGYFGTDAFTFRANDGVINSNTATVSITVINTNHAPVANAQSVSTNMNTPLPIALIATDADGDSLTYAIVASPAHGALSGTAPDLVYTPAANYSGSDSFTFRANDGITNSNTATISITVINTNHAPVASAHKVSTNQDTPLPIALIATDADGNSLTYAIVARTTHGLLTGTAPDLVYTPNAGYYGKDSFTFRANDGITNSNTATVSITVNKLSVGMATGGGRGKNSIRSTTVVTNYPPALSSIGDKTVTAGSTLTFKLSAYDPEGSTITYSATGLPTGATLIGNTFSWIPTSEQIGDHSVTFIASDGALETKGTITITVVNAE